MQVDRSLGENPARKPARTRVAGQWQVHEAGRADKLMPGSTL